MKAVVRVLCIIAVVAVLSAQVHLVDAGGAEARACYDLHGEVQKMGSHYRHIVYVENDCEYWLQCTVWTDANPQPPRMLTVGPDMTEQTETNGASRFDDFRVFGTCHRK